MKKMLILMFLIMARTAMAESIDAVGVTLIAGTTQTPLDTRLDQHLWPYFPDLRWTTGVTRTVEADVLCKAGSTKDARLVTEAMKKEVFKRYGITSNFGSYEVDHFISLELGGANDLANLWPQPYAGIAYTARMKDVVETNLHRRICKGVITLEQAQTIITTDWIAEYKKIKGIK